MRLLGQARLGLLSRATGKEGAVDPQRNRLIRRRAQALLDRCGAGPPVDVAALIRSCGFEYRTADLGRVDGYAARVRGRLHIFVNERLAEPLQRLTAAHELGHVVLDHVGAPIASEAKEVEANHFAAALLAGPVALNQCMQDAARQLGVTEKLVWSALAGHPMIRRQAKRNALDKRYADWN